MSSRYFLLPVVSQPVRSGAVWSTLCVSVNRQDLVLDGYDDWLASGCVSNWPRNTADEFSPTGAGILFNVVPLVVRQTIEFLRACNLTGCRPISDFLENLPVL